MRILFVWSSAEFSTFDVARGYRAALERTGRYAIKDYRLYARMKYHAGALGEKSENLNYVSKMASDNILAEAMYHKADLVFIISGMALHPDAIWLLRKAGIQTAILFTESPYNDAEQREFHAVYPEMRCFTNERTSAVDGWSYLPHAYDPSIHCPVEVTPQYDVLMIGTLWRERIQFFDQVDWSGINVKFIGTWVAPPMPDDSSIGNFYEEGCVQNDQAPGYYGAAKICLNYHRAHPTAESLNPRVYELAACRAFQITDVRAELAEVFGNHGATPMGTFTTSEELGSQIRWWLAHPYERVSAARQARALVYGQTFDARVETLMQQLA